MEYFKKHWQYITAIVIVSLTFIFLYQPTLFKFWIADDFAFLSWFTDALKHPKIILKAFWHTGNAFSPDVVSFYRPLFNASFFLECKLLGANSLALRIINLFTELLCGIMLALVVLALNKKSSFLSRQQQLTWSFLSAFLFVLYPLHSEPLNWIAARMDPLVTLFILFSLWAYIQWRTKFNLKYFGLSIVSAILAFLSKEMAVSIPPLLFAYELLFQQLKSKSESRQNNNIIHQLLWSLEHTWLYWLILLAYFFIRKVVLGAFIAGYPDKMTNPLSLPGWLQGIGEIFIPINPLTIAPHDIRSLAWWAIIIVVILLTLVAAIKTQKHNLKILFFLLIWFVLSLAPVYKIFPTLMGCTSGSRLAYLATAPVCIFLTFGLATFFTSRKFNSICKILSCALLIAAASILYDNNIAWAEAGHLTNKFIQEVKKYYTSIEGDPLVYAIGLPMITNKGIAVCLGSFDGITKQAVIGKNVYNFMRIDPDDQYSSFGFIKNAIATNNKNIKLLYWDSESEALCPSRLPKENFPFTRQWQGAKLKDIVRLPQLKHSSDPDMHWTGANILEVVSHTKGDDSTILELNLEGLPCWNIDFLALKLKFTQLTNLGLFKGAGLFFTNDILKAYSNEYFKDYFVLDCGRTPIKLINQEQTIFFQLRNLPAWGAGGACRSMRIILPANCIFQVKEIQLPETRLMMPIIELNSAKDEIPGKISLSESCSTQYIGYSATALNNSSQMLLEVTKDLDFFDFQDTNNDKLILLTKESNNLRGHFKLSLSDFPNKRALYRARIRALDRAGKQIGFPSDSFFIKILY